jgi:hypothetical protein
MDAGKRTSTAITFVSAVNLCRYFTCFAIENEQLKLASGRAADIDTEAASSFLLTDLTQIEFRVVSSDSTRIDVIPLYHFDTSATLCTQSNIQGFLRDGRGNRSTQLAKKCSNQRGAKVHSFQIQWFHVYYGRPHEIILLSLLRI